MIDIINQLREERATASNIKSKTTRKNVMAALDKIIQHLKLFRKTPENGLVVFAGNVSPIEGKEDIKLWSLEPPEKLETKIYWCDQVFVLDPLKDMTREKEVYGLITLDAREATIGLLKGKRIIKLKKLESTVPSKTPKGGMSQHRYDRIREDAINEFLTKVGDVASEAFLSQKDLRGIIIGGPGPVKEKLVDDDYLNYQLRKKILGVKDIGYTDEYGLKELVKRAEDLIEKSAIMREKNLLIKFFRALRENGNVVIGYENVKRAISAGAVETLLISEKFDWYKVKFSCQQGHEKTMELRESEIKEIKCPVCGDIMKPVEKESVADLLVIEVERMGGKTEFISTETEEGREFMALGGIGAFLRFKI